MVDNETPEAEFAQTFGGWLKARVKLIFDDATMGIISPDGELIPFPRTVVWGDTRREDVLDKWNPQEMRVVTDRAKEMAMEAILLLLGSLPQNGWSPADPIFALCADLASTFYVRGFILGAELGYKGSVPMKELDDYLDGVIKFVDMQAVTEEGEVKSWEDEEDDA